MMIKKNHTVFLILKLYIHPKKLYSSLFTAFCKSTPFLVKTKKKKQLMLYTCFKGDKQESQRVEGIPGWGCCH